jgi:hypothetical protein
MTGSAPKQCRSQIHPPFLAPLRWRSCRPWLFPPWRGWPDRCGCRIRGARAGQTMQCEVNCLGGGLAPSMRHSDIKRTMNWALLGGEAESIRVGRALGRRGMVNERSQKRSQIVPGWCRGRSSPVAAGRRRKSCRMFGVYRSIQSAGALGISHRKWRFVKALPEPVFR